MFRIAMVFRFVEMCLAMVLVSWTFTRLPFAVKISCEYFRLLYGIVLSPLFVFILCNVIIVTLLANSGWFSRQNGTSDNAETEIYEEFIKNSGDRSEPPSETAPPAHEPELVEYQDKQIIFEDKKRITTRGGEAKTVSDLEHPKVCRRTKSEKFERESPKKSSGKLRRSETEKCWKVAKSDEYPPEKVLPDLSNEEFQRTIESFIAKQWKFHREESLAIVLQNQS